MRKPIPLLTKRRSDFARFAILAIVILSPGVSLAADYYVDSAISTNGIGSIDAPFKSIQEGMNHLVAGDTLWIRGDALGRVYSESLSSPVSGTASHPITVRAYPSEKVILTGKSGTRLKIDKDHWIVDGLMIDQAGLEADAVKIKAKHIIIKNAEIRNGQREGVSIENAAFVTIQDSYIHDFMWIRNGTREDAHCIMIDTDRSPTITNIIIQRNTIERCSGDGTQIFGVTGQDISTYAKNIEFLDNTFIDGTTEPGLTENALDFKAADMVIVRGNTMTGYKNNKTIVVQKGCRNIRIEKNTISDGDRGIEMRQEGGIDFLQKNNSIVDNIVRHISSYALKFDGVVNITVAGNTLAHVGEPFRFESDLGSSVPSVNGGLITYNLIYAAGKAPRIKAPICNVDVGFNGWFQASAGELSRSTDTTGFDPLFVNPSIGDYRLQAGSVAAAIQAGTPVILGLIDTPSDLCALEINSGADLNLPAAPRGLRIIN